MKRKVGRPKFVLDYEKLEALCKIQCTEVECCAILGCKEDTLALALKADGHVNFQEYFKRASSGGKMSLRRRQFKAAVEDGNVTMLIWLGKQYLGQKDAIENSGEVKSSNEVVFRVINA